MEVLYGVVIAFVSGNIFRWFFTKSGIREKLWLFVGRKVPLHRYSLAWMIMTVFIVVVIKSLMESFYSNDLIIELVYLLVFMACFGLMPGLDVKEKHHVEEL